MPRLLFIQHGPRDAPGLLAEVARERGAAWEVVHPWRGETLPESLAGWSGLALGGGTQSAYQESDYPFLVKEKSLLREARERGVPTLGLCLGAQLMASAFGAEVKPNRWKEIGFYPVTFSAAAAEDTLWKELPSLIPAHWHGDTFDLPSGAMLLASSALTAHQLFVCDGRHYGLQFHLEMDLPIFDAMIADDLADLGRDGFDPEALRSAARAHFPQIESAARTVFHRWIDLVERASAA